MDNFSKMKNKVQQPAVPKPAGRPEKAAEKISSVDDLRKAYDKKFGKKK